MRFFTFGAASFLAMAPMAWSVRDRQVQTMEATAVSTSEDEWSLLHITDMQYGMWNCYNDEKTWKPEDEVMKQVVTNHMQSTEDITFIGGDMQDAYPFGEDSVARGGEQRQALVATLEDSLKPKTNFIFTPGNHDIADNNGAITEASLTAYKKNWKTDMTGKLYDGGLSEDKGLWGSFVKGKQLVLVLTSQFYTKVVGDSSDAVNIERAGQQNSFIEEQIQSIPNGVTSIVVLTHIPPFMESPDENDGWANWKKESRDEVLKMLAKAKKPILFVCGHFHATVFSKFDYVLKGEQGEPDATVKIQVLVTTAAATTLHWKGLATLSPATARSAADGPISNLFFPLIMVSNDDDKSQKRFRDEPNPREAAVGKLYFNADGLVTSGTQRSQWCYVDTKRGCVNIDGEETTDIQAQPMLQT